MRLRTGRGHPADPAGGQRVSRDWLQELQMPAAELGRFLRSGRNGFSH